MKTILVVDDELDLLQSICATLELGGYKVVGAGNGRAALEQLSKSMPDLLLTDVMMPYVTGYDLVDRLRRMPQGKKLPVIIMSSIEPALHPDGTWDRVLQKPFSLTELLETVQELVGT